MKRSVFPALLSILTLAACTVAQTPPAAEEQAGPAGPATVIFLARHAEAIYPPPEDAPRNPPLNAMGQARAEALARLLGDAGVDRVWSTDYARTQETAAPLATELGLEVAPYDPADLPAFAGTLRGTPGRHVVLGHSNTTPQLVEALGGEPGAPIDEPTEYDRLYVVTIGADGQVTTTLLRYGDPTPTDWQGSAMERR